MGYGTDDLKSMRGTVLVVLSVSGVLFVCSTPESDLWGWLDKQNSWDSASLQIQKQKWNQFSVRKIF